MNTAIRGGGAQGIGFSVPVSMLKQLVPLLLQHGRIRRSAIGAHPRRPRAPARRPRPPRRRQGRSSSSSTRRPGVKAKLALGDVIVRFDGKAIERATHLQWLASMAGVGRRSPCA